MSRACPAGRGMAAAAAQGARRSASLRLRAGGAQAHAHAIGRFRRSPRRGGGAQERIVSGACPGARRSAADAARECGS